MKKAWVLVRGWDLWANTLCHGIEVIPVFRKNGRELTPLQMAQQPEAQLVFQDLKQKLDVVDREWKLPGEELRFRVLDLAKIALQIAMNMDGIEKWDQRLLETGVE